MIYCIGLTATYDAALARGPVPKLGKSADYAGGSVWQTAEAAARFIRDEQIPDRSVYGVDADWDRDTVQVPGEPFRRLLRDALLVKLDHAGERK